jgi:hypothetical protein
MKLQGSGVSSREILQSQISLFTKNRFNIKELPIVHGRLLFDAQVGEGAALVG